MAAAGPHGAVNAAWEKKLRGECRTNVNSWDGAELVLGVTTTGGRAHPHFAGSLRGWCLRAAQRQGHQGTLDPAALGAAYTHRAFGLPSVAVQNAVHTLMGENYDASPHLSRPEAGAPAAWEAWLAAAGADDQDDRFDVEAD